MATNVFDLFAKISLDTTEYKKNLIQARTAFNTFVNGMSKTAPLSLKPTVKAVEEASQKIEKSVEDSAESIKEATEDASKESKKSIKEVLKDLETEAKESKGKINDIAENISDKMSNAAKKVKDAFSTIAKVTAGAVATGTAAVGALAKSSLDSYASYEQLVGGVETLFKDSADEVKKYADNAYKTAGMSANDYMDTAIQFSASLINSLDGNTEKAAKQVDKAITDMSDNVNKMGTSVESVQNAYRGFSRGNFTMLDNLSLGFAGTKEGMQHLLDKAHELSGIEYDIESYSDIVDAIHEVQVSMGITGTTAKEAAGTIEGSTASMKAAWHNLLIELGKEDGNVGGAFSVLFGSAKTNLSNTLPRVKQIARGIGQLSVTILAEIKKSLKENSSEDNNILTDLIDIAREYFPAIRHFAKDIFIELGSRFVEYADNIDFKAIGEKIQTGVTNAVDWIKGLLDNFNAEKFGNKLAEILNSVDWGKVIGEVMSLIAKLITEGGDLIRGFVDEIGWENLVNLLSVAFMPKFFGAVGAWFSGTEAASVLGGLGSFIVPALSAAMGGWALGTAIREWILKEFGEDTIDDMLFPILDGIKKFVWGEDALEEPEIDDKTYWEKALLNNPSAYKVRKFMEANDFTSGDMQRYIIDKANYGTDTETINALTNALYEYMRSDKTIKVEVGMNNGTVVFEDSNTFVSKFARQISESLETLRVSGSRNAGGAGY